MDDIELMRKIVALEDTIEGLQRELNQRDLAFGKVIQDLGAKLQVYQLTLIELLKMNSQRSLIAQGLRSSVQSVVSDIADQAHIVPHYESSMLLALNAMLDAAGEAPQR
jgi:hypothetical protein